MPDDSARIESFQEKIRKIRSNYRAATYLRDDGDVEAAVFMAKRLCDSLSTAIDEVRATGDHNAVYIDERLSEAGPPIAALLDRISEIEARAATRDINRDVESIRDFDAAIDRISRLTSELERSVKRIFPMTSSTRQTIAKLKRFILIRQKSVAAVAAATLIAFVGWKIWTRDWGLNGQYYEGKNFERFVEARIDHEIAFNWRHRSPVDAVGKDGFSVRWSGFVLAPVTGEYEFTVSSNDGARLWIGDKLLVDDWTTRPWKRNHATISLEKGAHPIKLEYFEDYNVASAYLSWQVNNGKRKVIPARFLRREI